MPPRRWPSDGHAKNSTARPFSGTQLSCTHGDQDTATGTKPTWTTRLSCTRLSWVDWVDAGIDEDAMFEHG